MSSTSRICEDCDDAEQLNLVKCNTCQKQWHATCADVEVSVASGLWNCAECEEKTTEDNIRTEEQELAEIEAELALVRREKELLKRKQQIQQRRQSVTSHESIITQRTNLPPHGRPNAQSTSYHIRQNESAETPVNPQTNRQAVNNGSSSSPTTSFAMLSHQQLMARSVIPKELPKFSGKSSEWPLFISSYKQSTTICGISDEENLMRLQKSLTGDAKSLVAAQLGLPSCVKSIIEMLEMVFGRPEYIIDEQLESIRSAPPPKAEKLDSMVVYSVAVKNLCATLEQSKMEEHLKSPSLLRELIDRLPHNFKLDWISYRRAVAAATVKDFSDWLHELAMDICSVTKVNFSLDASKSKSKNLVAVHTQETEEKNNKQCVLCKGDRHSSLADCKKYHEMSLKLRWENVKKFKLCRICLKKHYPYCDIKTNGCKIDDCQQSHHPTLHKSNPIEGEKADLNASHSSKDSRVICRIIPVAVKGPKKEVKTYAFLDSGSTVTMMDEKLRSDLGIVGDLDPLHLKWTSDSGRTESTSQRVTIQISGDYKNAPQYSMRARTVNQLSLPSQTLDMNQLVADCKYLKRLPIKSYDNVKPTILIGLDNWNLASAQKMVENKPNQPTAVKSRLGWSIEGPWSTEPNSDLPKTFSCNVHICKCEKADNEELHQMIKSYFEFDRLPYKSDLETFSMDDQRAMNILKNTVRKVEDKRYEAGLLWKYDKFSLPNSRPMAVARHKCLEKQLKSNPKLSEEMNRQILAYIEKGYARKLTPEEVKHPPQRTWYLPIFPVINPNKPGKVRMVFDAAAKVDGVSLNDMLLKGPDLNSSLFGVLIRFRQKKYATIGDLSEMYHQIRVVPKDQHAQRFLWRESPDHEFTEYVLQVLTFGASCSPCIAQYVKNFNADNYATQFEQASAAIKRNCYVDDELYSVDTENDAIEFGKQTKFIYSQGGFNIRNWRSNSAAVQEALEPSEPTTQHKLDVSGGDAGIEKVLGMFWDTQSDCFTYSFKYNKGNEAVLAGKKKATKRELLRIQMSLYDPLGLIAHYIMQIKLLLKEIWQTGSQWDDEISDAHQKQFENWLSHIPEVESLKVPRCYLSSTPNWVNCTVQLHVFNDAGENGYASSAYLRIETPNGIECRLVTAKSRVAPIKMVSMPRLELEATRLGARLGKVLQETLDVPVQRTYYWTDSGTVLIWLRSDAKSNPAFIAFRVAEIQDLTDIADWHYVPSAKNEIDKASKKFDNYSIKADSTWFVGPAFLYQSEEKWPKEKKRNQVEPKTETVAIHHTKNIEWIIKPESFSSWWRMLRVVARIIHYRGNLTAKDTPDDCKPKGRRSKYLLSSRELFEAEMIIMRAAQHDEYSAEIEALSEGRPINLKSKIITLNPYLDENGVLRSNSRLTNCVELDEYAKKPIILPRKHHVTFLIVRHQHVYLSHQNHETVINNIRQRYWIPKLRVVLKNVRANCIECKISTAAPEPPQLATLPEGRLSISRVFTHTGVDCFGPITVVDKRKPVKRYGVIFTCLSTRAVHIEVVHSMTTNSFIQAFQRFISRRGKPRVVYSDNGKNFEGAERQLRQEWNNIDTQALAENFVDANLDWRFNSPLAPHQGGSWERLIRSIKKSLYAMIPTVRLLNDETLITLMALVENTINSRPLTYIPTDEASNVLTPNHFILSSANGVKPLTPIADDTQVLLNTWKRTEELANKFWKRWCIEYLPTLSRRVKWCQPVEPLKIDDIVVMIDESLPRNCWPKGKIIKVSESKDGQVRSATVQTFKAVKTDDGWKVVEHIFKRPAVKLAKLDIVKPDAI